MVMVLTQNPCSLCQKVIVQAYLGVHVILPSVGMSAWALLVARPIHVALAFGDVVQYNEVKLDLLLAIAIGSLEDIGASIGDARLVDDQGGGGSTLIFVM